MQAKLPCTLWWNSPHRLICLNVWSLVAGIVWEGVGGVVLLEEECHWGVIEISNIQPLSTHLSLLPVSGVNMLSQQLQLPSLCSAAMDSNSQKP